MITKYTDIDFSNNEYIRLLERFYNELYANEFPEDERESLENIMAQAKRMTALKQCNYHCIIATQDNKIIGGVIGDYFSECNSGIIEFLVVDSRVRNMHIGSRLIEYMESMFNHDAHKADKKLKCIDHWYFECENPDKLEGKLKQYGKSRLQFFNKLGAYKIDIDYIQPANGFGKESVDCLCLCMKFLDKNKYETQLKRDELLLFLDCYFKYAFNTSNNCGNAELTKIRQDTKNKEFIEIERI